MRLILSLLQDIEVKYFNISILELYLLNLLKKHYEEKTLYVCWVTISLGAFACNLKLALQMEEQGKDLPRKR